MGGCRSRSLPPGSPPHPASPEGAGTGIRARAPRDTPDLVVNNFYSPNQPIPLRRRDVSHLTPPSRPTPCRPRRGRGTPVVVCPAPPIPAGTRVSPGQRGERPGGRGKRQLDGNKTSASLRFGHLVPALLSSDILNKYKESLALLSSIRLHDGVEPSDFHQSSIK